MLQLPLVSLSGAANRSLQPLGVRCTEAGQDMLSPAAERARACRQRPGQSGSDEEAKGERGWRGERTV